MNAIQNNDLNFEFYYEDTLKSIVAVIRIQYNWSYLHVAVWLNRPEIAENLLRLGSNPNKQDHNGETPLHLALLTGQSSLAKLLIEKGAKMDIKNIVNYI